MTHHYPIAGDCFELPKELIHLFWEEEDPKILAV